MCVLPEMLSSEVSWKLAASSKQGNAFTRTLHGHLVHISPRGIELPGVVQHKLQVVVECFVRPRVLIHVLFDVVLDGPQISSRVTRNDARPMVKVASARARRGHLGLANDPLKVMWNVERNRINGNAKDASPVGVDGDETLYSGLHGLLLLLVSHQL